MPETKAPIEQRVQNNHPPVKGVIQNVRETERLASAATGGALIIYGLTGASSRLPVIMAGSYLLYRGLSGYCPFYQVLGINSQAAARPSHSEHTMTIAADQAEIYRLWRDFANLPRFMRHLEEVQVMDDTHSHWVAKGPAGTRVSWDAEIFLERENEVIAWRSTPDAQIANAGSVHFVPAPGGRGTEVRVVLEYMPPAGALGQAVARLLGEEPAQQVRDDLRRLKMIVEAGEVTTNVMRPQTSTHEEA